MEDHRTGKYNGSQENIDFGRASVIEEPRFAKIHNKACYMT